MPDGAVRVNEKKAKIAAGKWKKNIRKLSPSSASGGKAAIPIYMPAEMNAHIINNSALFDIFVILWMNH